jgi:hypothetical protein
MTVVETGDRVEGIGPYPGLPKSIDSEATRAAMLDWNRRVAHLVPADGWRPLPGTNGAVGWRPITARVIAAAYGVPTWMLDLPWLPGDVEHPRRSRMHAAYHHRR